MPNQPKPTVGRVVHYVSYGTPNGEYPSVCRAAVVTDTSDGGGDTVSLAVLNPTGLFFTAWVVHHEAMAPGTWHWPERAEEGG
jgi:hypothetical protein